MFQTQKESSPTSLPMTPENYANEALAAVHQRFPQGAANRMDTFFEPAGEDGRRHLKTSFLQWYRDVAEKVKQAIRTGAIRVADIGTPNLRVGTYSPIDDLLCQWLLEFSCDVDALVNAMQAEYLNLNNSENIFCSRIAEKPRYFFTVLTGLLATVSKFSNGVLMLQSMQTSIETKGKDLRLFTQSLTFGSCLIFTDYALGYLRQKYPKSPILFEALLVGTHAMLLIGRQNANQAGKGALENPEQWGEVIICDPWINKIYTTEEFLTLTAQLKQKNLQHADYPGVDYINYIQSKNGIGGFKWILAENQQQHYLAGNILPQVDGRKSYNDIIEAWVRQEEAQKAPSSKISSALKSTLYTTAISSQDILIQKCTENTGISGWKVSKEGAHLWKRCATEMEAKQVCEQLIAQGIGGAECVTQSIQNQTIFIVRCDKQHFACTVRPRG